METEIELAAEQRKPEGMSDRKDGEEK